MRLPNWLCPWEKLREDNQVLASALLLLLRKVEIMNNADIATALMALATSVDRAVAQLTKGKEIDEALSQAAIDRDAALADRDATLSDIMEMREQMTVLQAKLDAAAPPA